ncbi:hypothetical protein NXX60_26545 [Bacteroides thetaiotaomicron]|nr:hypothetical protein NXX60_26545 [Bacteroides thetaiotaomicron]
MIRQEQLNQWLGDRQRKYVDGLVLFNALAKEAMKKKFAAYLAATRKIPTSLIRISPNSLIACPNSTRRLNSPLPYILPQWKKLL